MKCTTSSCEWTSRKTKTSWRDRKKNDLKWCTSVYYLTGLKQTRSSKNVTLRRKTFRGCRGLLGKVVPLTLAITGSSPASKTCPSTSTKILKAQNTNTCNGIDCHFCFRIGLKEANDNVSSWQYSVHYMYFIFHCVFRPWNDMLRESANTLYYTIRMLSSKQWRTKATLLVLSFDLRETSLNHKAHVLSHCVFQQTRQEPNFNIPLWTLLT